MKAVLYDTYGELPVITDLPEPDPPVGGVVVAVHATGVCRSDHHAWTGADPVSLPHVPGHELVGTVAAVGAGVQRWSVGDRVTAPFVCGCGACAWCRDGAAQVCPDQTQPGFTHHGSFAEFVVLHAADTNLVAVPETIGDVEAAALGCRFATAYGALRIARPNEGEWLAVHGAGGVGLSAVMVARAMGLQVLACDVAADALGLAAGLGAQTLDISGLSPRDVAERVVEITGGGAHVGIDAVGVPAAAVASIGGLRRRGRHVQAGLLLGANATPPLPMDRVVAWELSVHGVHGLAAAEYPAMLALAADLDLSVLVGRVIGLAEAPAALAGMSGPATSAGLTVVDLRGEESAGRRRR